MWNPGVLHCRWILHQLSHQGSHNRGQKSQTKSWQGGAGWPHPHHGLSLIIRPRPQMTTHSPAQVHNCSCSSWVSAQAPWIQGQNACSTTTHPPHLPLAPSVFTCAGGAGFLDTPTPSGVLSLPLDGAGGAESCSGEHSGVGDSKCLSGVCISHPSNGGRLRPGIRASGSVLCPCLPMHQ